MNTNPYGPQSGDIFSEAGLKAMFAKYAAAVRNGGVLAISELAQAVGVDVETALHDIQKLVAKGFFGREAYIDYWRKALILPEIFGGKKKQEARPIRSQPAPAPEAKPALPSLEKLYRKPMRIFTVLAILFGAAGVMTVIKGVGGLILSQGAEQLINGLIAAALGGGCFEMRSILSRRAIRYRKYRMLAEGASFRSVPELAAAAGVSEGRAYRDLEDMTYKGFFGPRALVDRGARLLLASPEDRPQKETPPPEVKAESLSEYDVFLGEIRSLNDEIADKEVSARIDRIEELTRQIFRTVEEHPEKKSEIKSFMSYYLPTTLKLLRTYSGFEHQNVQGENIRTTKEKIAGILDKLGDGFEQQLNRLFRDDALDVSTDINVLETMLRRDGLTGEENGFAGTQTQQ